MKIYCTDNQKGRCKLTFGKDYSIIEETDNSYIISNDKKEVKSYLKNKFVDSKEKLNIILDRINNPNSYYKPIEIRLNIKGNSVEVENIIIDEELLGIGNIQEFLNIKPLYDTKVWSKNKYINMYNRHFDLGKSINNLSLSSYAFTNNVCAIKYAYYLSKEIEHINKVLINTKKEKKLVYLVEHEPNGKQYTFRSDEELYVTQLVICDTNNGQQYGVIKNVAYENDNAYLQRKTCRSIK